MSAGELPERLEPMAAAIRKKAWDHNGYISYYDEAVCPDTSFVVREYRDRKELVQLNEQGEVIYQRAL